MRTRRREEKFLVTGKEPSACCLSASVRNPPRARTVDAHDVLLIALSSLARALERQPLSVMTEVRFRVLTAKGDLLECAKMSLGWQRADDLRGCRIRRVGRLRRVRAGGEQQEHGGKCQNFH